MGWTLQGWKVIGSRPQVPGGNWRLLLCCLLAYSRLFDDWLIDYCRSTHSFVVSKAHTFWNIWAILTLLLGVSIGYFVGVWHRDGGREQALRRHARQRSRTTSATTAAVYPDTGATARPVSHGRNTILCSAIRRRIRRIRIRRATVCTAGATAVAAAAAAAGDGHQRQPTSARHLCRRDVLGCYHLFLPRPVVLQFLLRFGRLYPGRLVIYVRPIPLIT